MSVIRRPYVWLPISLLLLGFVIWRTRPWEAAALAGSIDLIPLGLALALNAAVIALWAVRSRFLMAAVGHPLRFTELVPIVSFANTINNLTPASTGEVLRAVVLKQRHAVPYTRSGAVILVERLWAIGIMGLTAAAAAVGPLLHAPAPIVTGAWAAAILGCFTPTVLYALGLRPGRLVRRFLERRAPAVDQAALTVASELDVEEELPPGPGRGRRIATAFVELDDVLGRIVTDPAQALIFVGTTALIFLCFAVQLGLILAALQVPLALDAAWAALGLATIAGVASALPFGLGATDAVLVLLLAGAGVEAAAAGATVLLLRAVVTLPLGVAGAISWTVLSRFGGAAVGAR